MLLSILSQAGVMELADVVDSKSTASDGVPVRVRPPAPKYGIPHRGIPYFYADRTRTAGESPGSEPTAASGEVKGGERVAAVGVQRSRSVGKAHTGHRNRNFSFYRFALH